MLSGGWAQAYIVRRLFGKMFSQKNTHQKNAPSTENRCYKERAKGRAKQSSKEEGADGK